MSRTSKTATNIIVGIGFNVLSSLANFVLQAVFIRLLGLEYSGINGLFTQIISVLNLADLGFNNAILFRLYKSISDKDTERTEMLLAMYKKVCLGVSIFVLLAGMCCIPFLDLLVKEVPSFPESLWSLFIIVLATNSVTQYMSYTSIYIVAKQDRYTVTIVNYSCTFASHILQILLLLVYKNIYLYLLVKLALSIVSGLILKYISKNRYGTKWHSDNGLSGTERNEFIKDIGALSVYKLCRTIDASVDIFIISKYISVATTAIYGSIMMIINTIQDLLCQINDGMIASIGDLNAEGDKNRLYTVFNTSFHFTYLSFGTCAAVLAVLISPLMEWWIGENLSETAIYVLLINFIIYGFGMNVATFRNSIGLFKKGWLRPGITALLNLVFSIALVFKFGIVGPLLGTTISRTLTLVWYDPFIVIKHGMGKKPYVYYLRYVFYISVTLLTSFILILIRGSLPAPNTFFDILWQGCLYSVCAVVLLLLFGALIPEEKEVLSKIFDMLKNILKKFKVVR